jgi:hypothetical protein
MDKFFGILNRDDLINFFAPGALILATFLLLYAPAHEDKLKCFLHLSSSCLILFGVALILTSYVIGYLCSTLGLVLDEYFLPDDFPTHDIFKINSLGV